MVHAKNYETMSKFVTVMPRILWLLFFPDTVWKAVYRTYLNAHYSCSIRYEYFYYYYYYYYYY